MMSRKRKNLYYLIALMLILEMVFHTSYGEPRNSISEQQGSRRLSRINREKDRNRLIRRLLQSSYTVKRVRNKGRQRFGFDWVSPKDYYDEDLGFETEDLPIEKKQSKPKKARKRFDTIEFQHGNEIDTNTTLSCCPQKFEIIEPTFGRNRSGHMVELYKDDRIQQRFYELICDPDIMNKVCRFLEGRVQRMSKCTQQHAFTYGLVRSDQSLSGWSLDHIRIRSGCVCKVFQSMRKKKAFERRKLNFQ